VTPEGQFYCQNLKLWQFWGLYSNISAPINVKFGTGKRTFGPLLMPNFMFIGVMCKPIFGLLSKNNTGMAALRTGLSVTSFYTHILGLQYVAVSSLPLLPTHSPVIGTHLTSWPIHCWLLFIDRQQVAALPWSTLAVKLIITPSNLAELCDRCNIYRLFSGSVCEHDNSRMH